MNNESDFIDLILRFDKLNTWLISRYQSAIIELNKETIKQLEKALQTA